jgi:transposase
LALKYQQLCELDQLVNDLTTVIETDAKQHTEIKRLQSIPGFGAIVSSTYFSVIGDGRAFGNGRDAAASLGLVPRQHSSGGKNTLLGISKRGDKYLRSLLVHGARSVVIHAHKKDDALSRWVTQLVARRGKNKATVALANKLARIAWAVTTSGKPYTENYAL